MKNKAVDEELDELSKEMNISIKNVTLRALIASNIDEIEKYKRMGVTYLNIYNKLNLTKDDKKIALKHFRDLIYQAKKKVKGINKIEVSKAEEVKAIEVEESKNEAQEIEAEVNLNEVEKWKQLFPFIPERLAKDIIEFGCSIEDGMKWKSRGNLNDASQIRRILSKLKEERKKEKFNLK